MNEVTVTVLPHPVTMFFIGAILLGMTAVLIEFTRIKREFKEHRKSVEDNLKVINSIKSQTEKSIQEISRKVDSRIDKALGNVKKG
jgi:hypothetical protein